MKISLFILLISVVSGIRAAEFRIFERYLKQKNTLENGFSYIELERRIDKKMKNRNHDPRYWQDRTMVTGFRRYAQNIALDIMHGDVKPRDGMGIIAGTRVFNGKRLRFYLTDDGFRFFGIRKQKR